MHFLFVCCTFPALTHNTRYIAMKRAITLLSLLAGLNAFSDTETFWLYGVNEYGGWYDADKTSSTEDYNKCWAAVSANMINWWQSQYQLPDTLLTGSDVWTEYRTKANTVMSNAQVGIDWWWSGKAAADMTLFYSIDPFTASSANRYYYSYTVIGAPAIYDYKYQEYVYFVEPEKVGERELTRQLYDIFSSKEPRQGITLNIGSSETASLHGITLWGAEFADSQTLTALWVTDSDDAIFSVGDQDLFRVSVEYKNGAIYLSDYWYEEARYLESLTVLDATKTDAWNLQRTLLEAPMPYALPEPTTATLSMLALAALATRRRRK